MGVYLIGQEIVFDSNNLTMRSAHDGTKKISIGSVASRCLKILLDAKGETVKKREIIHKAWGNLGLEVTENSLAQAIRQIRTAIKEFSPHANPIATIPRIGYKVIAKIEVGDSIQEHENHKLFNNQPVTPEKRHIGKSNIALASASSIIGFGLGSLLMMTTASC